MVTFVSLAIWPSMILMHAFRVLGDVVLVGDQHDRVASAWSSSRKPSTSSAESRVEIAGRLVGEEHLGLGDERASDRDSLLLTARELAGPMLDSIRQTHTVERVEGTLASLFGIDTAIDERAARRCATRSSMRAG